MVRYIFFTTGAQPWVNLASRLHDDCIATPVLWIGDPRHETAARAKFGGDVVQSMDTLVHYPWRLSSIDYKAERHEYFSSLEYYRAKDRALKMMDRLDLYGTFSRLDREIYFKNICLWGLKRISALNPDALIVNEAPHSHAQYALFEICRYLGIPAFKLSQWSIAPAVALVSFDGLTHVGPERRSRHSVHEKIEGAINEYIQAVRSTLSGNGYELKYMERQRRTSSFFGQLSTMFSISYWHLWMSRFYHRLKSWWHREYNPIAPSVVNFIFSSFGNRARRNFINSNNDSASVKPHLDRKYVYFGMHYEPERTSNPDGGEFHDQILAVTRLRSILPDDIAIYVKEHPSQLMASMRGVRGRSPLFYESVKNIRNVHVVDIDTPSIDLIRNAIFVSTITGTVALEAALLEKSALIFGDAWYKGIPNITCWREDVTFNDLVVQQPVSHDKVREHLIESFSENFAVGCQNNSFEKHFQTFIDEEFRRVESEELYDMFSRLFTLLKNGDSKPPNVDTFLSGAGIQ